MDEQQTTTAEADNAELDKWMNPDIIPFTKEHERMLTELHAGITGALKQIESAMPMLLPLLNGLGVSL